MPTTKGIMGYLKILTGPMTGKALRVESSSVKATQDVAAMETVDGYYDKTAYKLGPVKVEGDLSFPLPAEADIWMTILKYGMQRDPTTGNLLNTMSFVANYDNSIGYEYANCKFNNMKVDIASEEVIKVTAGLIGTSRTQTHSGPNPSYQQVPQRMLTWDNVAIDAGGDDLSSVPSGELSQIKTFNFEINNNTTAFFALNNSIFVLPHNIVAGKREVQGSIEMAWNGSQFENKAFNRFAVNGRNYCTTNYYITCTISSGCDVSSATDNIIKFWGVVYNIEDISLTNDFFMGTQTWRAYGHDGNSNKAISFDGTPY